MRRKSGTLPSSHSLSRPVRRSAVTACGLLVCLVCGWTGVQAARPFLEAAGKQAENDRLEGQISAFRIQNQAAERELQALRTPEGLMQAARALGYVRLQEQRLRVLIGRDPQ